ncbi:MAG: ABC transporter substrate-binding protein [Flavihumibacter sp.]
MTVSSFLPAATQMIYDMGLQRCLQGVSFECPAIALQEQPVVVHCELAGKNLSSIEIDRLFAAAKASGRSIYSVDEPLLQQIAPDIIFTQATCEICQIDTIAAANVAGRLKKRPQLVELSPSNLSDVFTMAHTIAQAMEQPAAAIQYTGMLQHRLDTIRRRLEGTGIKRVCLLEWTDPLYNCGHWIPDQLACAGGIDMLSVPSGDSHMISWHRLLEYDPEIIVLAPCGYTVNRTLEDMPLLTGKPEWEQLQAVHNNRVFIADFSFFTQPSASTLVEGVEILAACFHPSFFTVPVHLRERVLHFSIIGSMAIIGRNRRWPI